MSTPETPNWETANGFTAHAAPLWLRQVVGGVVAGLFFAGGIWVVGAALPSTTGETNHEKALQTLAISVGIWTLSALVIRFYVAIGWRVADELKVDFKTRAVQFGQRKLRGRRVRSVEVSDLTNVREVSYGSYRGEPLDLFEFTLSTAERIRFPCPPEILAITRRALQRVGLLTTSWKGTAVQPAATDGSSSRR